ncbi:hypothetical protein PIIN_11648 [Serendipita indica DSM 11827]|uniref:Uncharacterized protein n=1 Tax=Serendipita indica (strain DSM 11827) TaxID=1109443 RepID=G4U277_SERID|nr:hypothetical protein PIIN_11648 [Serendipita indica DSM 11827]
MALHPHWSLLKAQSTRRRSHFQFAESEK